MLLYSYIKQCTLVQVVYIVCLYVYRNCTYFFYSQKKQGSPVTTSSLRLCNDTFSLYLFLYSSNCNWILMFFSFSAINCSINFRISSGCVILFAPFPSFSKRLTFLTLKRLLLYYNIYIYYSTEQSKILQLFCFSHIII